MPSPPDTSELLRRSADDPAARDELLGRHRRRLRRMVAARLDARLAARLDPSDVVQEALADAARELPAYLQSPPLPFYPWLRRLALDRLDTLRRRHTAGRRDIAREEVPEVPATSAQALAALVADPATGPASRVARGEQRARVRAALAGLPESDREVLVVRFIEGLSTAEAAEALGVSVAAVKMRQMRALDRLRGLLTDDSTGAP